MTEYPITDIIVTDGDTILGKLYKDPLIKYSNKIKKIIEYENFNKLFVTTLDINDINPVDTTKYIMRDCNPEWEYIFDALNSPGSYITYCANVKNLNEQAVYNMIYINNIAEYLAIDIITDKCSKILEVYEKKDMMFITHSSHFISDYNPCHEEICGGYIENSSYTTYWTLFQENTQLPIFHNHRDDDIDKTGKKFTDIQYTDRYYKTCVINRINNIDDIEYEKPIWEYVCVSTSLDTRQIYTKMYKYPSFAVVWELIKRSNQCLSKGNMDELEIYHITDAGDYYDFDFDQIIEFEKLVDYNQYKKL